MQGNPDDDDYCPFCEGDGTILNPEWQDWQSQIEDIAVPWYAQPRYGGDPEDYLDWLDELPEEPEQFIRCVCTRRPT